MVDASVRAAATELAQRILSGDVAPYNGAAAIWARLAEEPGDYPDDLKVFVGLASEWQDHPEYRADLDADIRDEARRLVGEQGASTP